MFALVGGYIYPALNDQKTKVKPIWLFPAIVLDGAFTFALGMYKGRPQLERAAAWCASKLSSSPTAVQMSAGVVYAVAGAALFLAGAVVSMQIGRKMAQAVVVQKPLTENEQLFAALMGSPLKGREFTEAKQKFHQGGNFTDYVLSQMEEQAEEQEKTLTQVLFDKIIEQAENSEGDHLLKPCLVEGKSYLEADPKEFDTKGSLFYLRSQLIQKFLDKGVNFKEQEPLKSLPYFQAMLEKGILSPFVDFLHVSNQIYFADSNPSIPYWFSMATAWIGNDEKTCTFVIECIKKKVVDFTTLKDKQGETVLDYFEKKFSSITLEKKEVKVGVIQKMRQALTPKKQEFSPIKQEESKDGGSFFSNEHKIRSSTYRNEDNN